MDRNKVLSENPGTKIIKTRWVKVQKGSAVRCRLVVQEVAYDKRDDLFAGTPPLGAMRHLLSSAMSQGSRSWDQKVCIVDVRRAFLHGEAERDIFIELPEQDPQAKGGKCVGKLKKTLYGTRDAPQAGQKSFVGS